MPCRSEEERVVEAVIAIVALFFVLFVALGVYATVKAVGAAKRGVDRTITQAKRTVEDTTLRARSLAQPGPAGQLADLRLKLRTSMRATQEALQAGVGEDESLKESLALFEQLSKHGRELDGELRRLEPEPDRSKLAQRLPALRERTERVVKSADSLRWAAHDRARRFAEDDLDTLSAQIDVEAGALRHWTTEPAAVWPEAPKPEATASTGQTWQETPASRTAEPRAAESRGGESPGGEGPPKPAIAPASARPTYPWQKKPRPESTT
ncbi:MULTISPECIES: hypothetical protein [Streptomyces]|uniref:hypothetical protein n=1 Tax=Streptomyces TaxID=1883 RepID=UPI00062C2C91|nr:MULTISPECIES: hypothetical protein [Streptomyces]MDX2513803.1 hypothetical protein [Streptomyces stelliscabiei]MDX2550077.1 hypothetical protein [Streptomyces stelliscabiei]MDX2610504.1 hypothetical protein [Streptomyces stelliscabiei]MDX2635407.1 hypothetical protein [Streptomyces stelliscabiei]MDX2665680.1 hypothetical protein [Streptomyces stelliscabiei]